MTRLSWSVSVSNCRVSIKSSSRRADVLELFRKRQRNIRALENVIEEAGKVDVNAAAILSAVVAYRIMGS